MDFVYTLANLIRTPYDLIHLLFYVLMVIVAFILSLYIGNREEFNNYIYNPYLKHIHAKFILSSTLLKWNFLIFLLFIPRNVKWTPISNRSLYFSKLIKNVFDKFFK
jgi:hypothetical protein